MTKSQLQRNFFARLGNRADVNAKIQNAKDWAKENGQTENLQILEDKESGAISVKVLGASKQKLGANIILFDGLEKSPGVWMIIYNKKFYAK